MGSNVHLLESVVAQCATRACVLLLLAVAFVGSPAVAQAPPQVSQQQLDLYRSLPADQQQALLNKLSGTAGSGNSDAPLSNPATSKPNSNPANSDTAEHVSRIAGRATLILGVEVRGSDRKEADAETLKDRRARILAANPYRVDEEAHLELPFLPAIALRGLSADEAAQRLNADPRLAGLEFTVRLLPVAPVGSEALRPFGYDLFTQVPTTFAPATDIPVPTDYVVGPGDTLIVDLFGKSNGHYSLVVSREGRLQLPEIGPMQVAGLSFDVVSAQIQQRIAEQTIGVQAAVTMGTLRSIQVFVVGDVVRPGAYTISALSTMTNALFATGGVSHIGSLRNIELKRNGARVAGNLDLYDLLLRGDTSADKRLMPGDVIFVPPVGMTVSVAGQVLRPAIYELRPGQSVADAVALAGGLVPSAAAQLARLERIDIRGQRTVLDVDLTSPTSRTLKLQPGDVFSVPKVLQDSTGIVTLQGHVQRPGVSSWRSGMRLTDLVGSLEALKLNADQRYVLIRREHLPARGIEVLSADLKAAFSQPHGDADPLLESRDQVFVFSMQRDRGTELASLLSEIKLQVRDNQPVPTVFINGNVRAPGEYPLQTRMKLSDLLRAGGGLNDSAFAGTAELARYEVAQGERRRTEIVTLNIAEVIAGNQQADRELQPYDVVTVQRTPEWNERGNIVVKGEVKFPGTYPLRKGETLRSLIERAGGLSDEAFTAGAVFTRDDIREQQQQQIDVLASRMQSDLAVLALQSSQTTNSQNPSGNNTLALGQSLLTQLRTSKATGRLIINLDDALNSRPGSDADLKLEAGDVLMIPKAKQFVAVVGEVQNPSAHIWRKDLSRDDYIGLSGGVSRNADGKHIYVVRADGSVASHANGWFASGNMSIRPGDTVVAPLDAARMRPLPLWTSVTQVIYNLAIAAAAVHSF